MIVTLTPNPSLDRTIAVATLTRGGVHRARSLREDAGGKGVNVARALAANGVPTLAVLPAAGAMALQFGALLDADGVPHEFIDLPDAVRTNITVVEDDGTTTKINEPGRQSSAADGERLLDAATTHLTGRDWVVGCGSLPPGLDADFYARLVRRAREHGVRVAVDSSGAALAAVVAARPDLIKPNHHELADLAGRPLPRLGDVVDAAQLLVDAGIATVVVSLGPRGALAVSAHGAHHAWAHVAQPRSTVGAGDCLLAGWLGALTEGANTQGALATAVAWGSAAVALPGSSVPSPANVADVDVTLSDDLDRTLPMTQE